MLILTLLVLVAVWSDLMQGFSMQWWNNKHHSHHAVPNLHNSSLESQDGDPDIDTMLLLAWSLKQAQSFRAMNASGKDSTFIKYAIKFQAFTYFPILLLACISWLNVQDRLRKLQVTTHPQHRRRPRHPPVVPGLVLRRPAVPGRPPPR